jgi:hypothetical protein
MATTDTALRLLLFGEDKTASKALKGVGDSAGKAEGKLSKFGKGSKVAMGAMKAGIAGLIASEAVGMVTNLSDAYAQLEDSTAAASVVFGTSMDKIIAQAETASTTMGISKQQTIDAANTFGTYGKSAGLSGDKLAGFSTKMTALAGDMASFKGTSPEQAIEAIGAALRGETEPIRAYGVMLDDATLKAQAMKMGLIKTTKEALTPQQKVLAAQAQILKQTSDAQGDFARTSESTANVGKTAAAKWTDFQTVLGEKLAPAVTAVTQVGIEMMDWLEQNPAVIEGASAAFGILGDILKGLWDIGRKFVLPFFASMVMGAAQVTEGIAGMLHGLGTVPGFEWAEDAADKLDETARGVRKVSEGMTALSKEPKVDLGAKVAEQQAKQIDSDITRLNKKKIKLQSEGDTKGVDKLEEKIKALEKKKHKVSVEAKVYKTGIKGIRVRDIARGNIKISAYASGIASAPGGPAILGEAGPEAVMLPAGSRVLSNGQTRAAANQGRLGGAPAAPTIVARFAGRAAPPKEFAKYIEAELYKLWRSQGMKFRWDR